jgi:hypothetical protein
LVKRANSALRQIPVLAPFLFFALTSLACGRGGAEAQKKRIEPAYDKQTGRLQLLNYDSDGDGKVDTVSYMDGARLLRIEIDKDEDGTVERWEHYDADQKLQKVGLSRANDGKEDAWSYFGPDGSIVRIELSTRRDGNVTRTEDYENSALVRAEEDTDADGRTDKWETYEGGRLASVSFGTTNRAGPDRRLLYGADGSVRLEVDPDGDGQFVAVNPQK